MNPKDSVGAKKAPTRFVPQALVLEAAAVMATGAVKYGPFNWREQPVSAVTYAEAIQRHLSAWVEGQDTAEDSGLNHIAHIAASCGILLDAAANGTLLDDRTAGPAADILRRLDQSSALPKTMDEARSFLDAMGDAVERYPVGSLLHPVGVPEPWGTGWENTPADLGVIDLRGEYPPDTRVAGLLTCCGQTEHPLDCSHYRD